MLCWACVQAGMKAREQALYAALDDMESWLATGTIRADMFSKTIAYCAIQQVKQAFVCTCSSVICYCR